MPSNPCTGHTEGPGGYLSRLEWARQMTKTHTQTRCPGCGLWKVWVKR